MRRSTPILLISLLSLLIPAGAAADFGDNTLGLNTHLPGEDFLDMAAALGVPWIRVDANWWQMEPADGSYDWAPMDAAITGASARGLSVYMTLAYTPEWVPKVPRSRTDGYTGNDEPIGSAEWVRFVEAAVARYRAMGVTHFGIWNEANLEQFWDGSIDAYIDKILIPGADAVRRTCADCQVLGPDLAHVGDYHLALDRILERASGSFDILAHHIYNQFEETGWQIFDGDSFLNALETRRVSFTRPALREILDERGWTGEVWITETGYRADPPGDAEEEDLQAIYVTRVMEEQLLRRWWTNTFFYEATDCGIDIPGCGIDGFGLTRPSRPAGGRAFPGDYRIKPAFNAIRDFIDAHPEIVMSAPPLACADGMDNDGDGRVDGEDRGCADGLDDDEADDPPRLRLTALPGEPSVDGDLGDWSAEGWIALGPESWHGTEALSGPGDLIVRAAARFGAGTLYLAVEVIDDVHDNREAPDRLYLGDSLQVAFDVGRNYGDAYDATDDHELNFAMSGGEMSAYRFTGPAGASDGWAFVVRREGSGPTVYELALPEAALTPASLVEGAVLGFSFLVNEADGAGRLGWIEWTPGIGLSKVPYDFGEIALAAELPPEPDGGVPGRDGGAPGRDSGASGRDAGPGGGGGEGCGCRVPGRSDRGPGAPLLALLLLSSAGIARARRRKL